MKSYEQIAAAMYRAFIKQANGREVDAFAWEALSLEMRACWIAAARQAAAELALVH